VVETPDQYVELHIGGCHILLCETEKRALFVDRMDHGPVHRKAFHPGPFEVQIIIPVFRVAIHLDLQAHVHPDLHVREGMVVLVGGKAEHQRRRAPERTDQRKVAEDQVAPWTRKTAEHETHEDREGQQAIQRLDGRDDIGPVAHGVHAAVTNRGEGLRAEEKSFLEFSPGRIGDQTSQLVAADVKIDQGIAQVDDKKDEEDQAHEFPTWHVEQLVIHAEAVEKGHAFLTKIESPVPVDETATVAGGVGAKPGVVVDLQPGIDLLFAQRHDGRWIYSAIYGLRSNPWRGVIRIGGGSGG